MSVLEIDSNEEVMEADEVSCTNLPWLAMKCQAQIETKKIAFPSVIVGELIGMTNFDCTPLVLFPGQLNSEAVTAKSVLDLQISNIGQAVVLMFEGADASKPIIMGLLNENHGSKSKKNQVEVEADGQRMVISAKEQIVLQCGKASITLTKAGKVLINGAYISSRSSGAQRIKGGSVEIN